MNYLFLVSDNGGRAASILYSIVASTKSNQVEPTAYVRDLLNRLSENSVRDCDELLPDAWLAVHPEARRQWS